MTLTYSATSRYHNYGHLIKFFCSKSDKYILSKNEDKVDLSDKNSLSRIKHYIDGCEFMTIKYLFLKILDERFIIDIKDIKDTKNPTQKYEKGVDYRNIYEIFFPYYLKPSHAFIGGGKGIFYIGNKEDFEKVKDYVFSKKEYNYFIDPVIKNTLKWEKENESKSSLYKWDCRTYGIFYLKNNILKVFLGKRGYARFETDSINKLTNLSLIDQSLIDDYMVEIHSDTMKEINKQIKERIIKVFVEFIQPQNEKDFEGFVILGFDSILSTFPQSGWARPFAKQTGTQQKNKFDDDNNSFHFPLANHPSNRIPFPFKVNFIEVNDSPVMIASKRNIEGIITYDIFEELIEKILFGEEVNGDILEKVYEKPIAEKNKKFDFEAVKKENKRFFTFIEKEKREVSDKRNKEMREDEYIE